MSWVTSWRLPPVSVTASGTPLASTIRWCSEPGGRGTGDGPTWSPLWARGCGSRRPRTGPGPAGRWRAAGPAAARAAPVTRRPRSVAQPPPAGHSRTAGQCGGQLVPGEAGLRDEHIAGECGAVVDRPAAGERCRRGSGGGSSGAIRSHSPSGTSSSVTQHSLDRDRPARPGGTPTIFHTEDLTRPVLLPETLAVVRNAHGDGLRSATRSWSRPTGC